MDCDTLIIGGGPGGYTAAIRGAQLGKRICLVESGYAGGACLNKGCIPTKVMTASISVLESIRKADEFGIKVESYSINFDRIMERKSHVVNQLRKGIEYLLKKNGIIFIRGTARLLSDRSVEIKENNGQLIAAETEGIILATGSRPLILPQFNHDGEYIMSSDDLLEIDAVPESLLVIGGGVIGCEFACIFNALGSKVIVVDIMDRIIPGEDEEISSMLKASMIKKGIKVLNGIKIQKTYVNDCMVSAELENGKILQAEKALLCLGRIPDTEGLDLGAARLKTGTRGEIPVNDRMETVVPGIYAVGDVTGKLLLAHAASAQGIVAINNICDRPEVMKYDVVPGCIFTHPEIASVGMTSKQAVEKGLKVKSGRFPFAASGKALSSGCTEGMVKVLASEADGRILGVHIIGPEASNLIGEAAAAMEGGMTAEQLGKIIHAHPTLSESLMEAAEAVDGKAIHI